MQAADPPLISEERRNGTNLLCSGRMATVVGKSRDKTKYRVQIINKTEVLNIDRENLEGMITASERKRLSSTKALEKLGVDSEICRQEFPQDLMVAPQHAAASLAPVLLVRQILCKMIVISPGVRVGDNEVFHPDSPSFIAEKFADALQKSRGDHFEYNTVNDIAGLDELFRDTDKKKSDTIRVSVIRGNILDEKAGLSEVIHSLGDYTSREKRKCRSGSEFSCCLSLFNYLLVFDLIYFHTCCHPLVLVCGGMCILICSQKVYRGNKIPHQIRFSIYDPVPLETGKKDKKDNVQFVSYPAFGFCNSELDDELAHHLVINIVMGRLTQNPDRFINVAETSQLPFEFLLVKHGQCGCDYGDICSRIEGGINHFINSGSPDKKRTLMADDYDGKKKPKSADPAARIVTPANAPARSRCELSTEDEEEDSDDGYSSDDDYAADAATPSRYRLSMKDEEEDFNDDSSSKNSEKTVALIDLSRDEDEDRSIFESIESAPKVRGKKSNAVIDLTRDEDED